MSTKFPTNSNEQSNNSLDLPSPIYIDPLIRLKDLIQLIGLGRSTVYKMISQGLLEPPVRISERTVGWRSSTVQAFIESRKSPIATEDTRDLGGCLKDPSHFKSGSQPSRGAV